MKALDNLQFSGSVSMEEIMSDLVKCFKTILKELKKQYEAQKAEQARKQAEKEKQKQEFQKKMEKKKNAWKELNSKVYSFYSKTLSNMRFQSDYLKKKFRNMVFVHFTTKQKKQ